ncbi:hypothetical protein [Clostridium beijerinckii]|uniref:hypothetical protein n=1 Tax=Clostridium beijerinckii TaxID=1520 RepID=UPI001ECAFA79|nr:hypothetical protein [Clostridium beijerinckii]NOV59940.1 hypothetical protein [Clostridium beijerinckii]NOV71277.1 hypothetical protein [Clostridium beijerinckii]NOW34201.1 hypothetical protein [Clostridium beijerinckii]
MNKEFLESERLFLKPVSFDVKHILTKAVPMATERINALMEKGYKPINKKFIIYDDYYCREI